MVLSVHKLPMKYTVSGSTLQYKIGLTLSFLSLISRAVKSSAQSVEDGTVTFCTCEIVGTRTHYSIPGTGAPVLVGSGTRLEWTGTRVESSVPWNS